jgi:hypothetical protein
MRCWFVFALAVACLVPQSAVAQAKGKEAALNQIFADWKHRQGLLKAARYVIVGTTEVKDPDLPSGTAVWPSRSVLLLDLAGKRFRLETSEGVLHGDEGTRRKFAPRVSTSANDGKVGGCYTHREANGIPDGDAADLIINLNDAPTRGTWFDPHLWPVFYAHGLIPTVQTDVRLNKLPMSYDPDNFEVRGRQTARGRNYTVVQTDPMAGNQPIHDELWIDLSQQSTIHRHVYFNGSNPWYRQDVEWKQTALGWWPEKWTLTWTRNGQVRLIHRLKVESFEPNPPLKDGDFTLPAKPGMKVSALEYPSLESGLNPYMQASKTYLVLPSGAWQEVDAKGFTTMEGTVLPPGRSRAWIWWSVAAVALAAGLAGYLFRRRQNRAAARRLA